MPELCLGTVQFGVTYGVTNTKGQVTEAEVQKVLKLAASSGIELLDTAQDYGTSEAVLGRWWPKSSPRRLISKLSSNTLPECWETSFQSSLKKLQVDRLDGFLLHNATDLLGPNGDHLIGWLESLRNRELVKRIGISIYEASELEGIPLDRLQLVQLPLSLYDQRLIQDGTLDRLHGLGIAIHARSIFLQGLLLKPPEDWPKFMTPSFREHHAHSLIRLQQNGATLLDAAIQFARHHESVEAVLVGVLTADDLKQVLQSWKNPLPAGIEPVRDWAWNHTSDLDPRLWQAR